MQKQKLTTENLAWLAGIIDGEGCIFSTPVGKKGRRGTQLSFTLGMSHQSTIRRVKKYFQMGTVRRREIKSPRKKLHWRWEVHCQRATACVRLILPYLHTKKKQAVLFLKIADSQKGNRGKWLTPSLRAKQIKWVDQLKKEKTYV